MIRALWTASSGMYAQQLNIDTIANNLANVNTPGFKKNRVDFQELFYETVRASTTPAGSEQTIPSSIAVGYGVQTAASQKIFSQGPIQPTNNPLDLAIMGDGFFRLEMPDGTIGYSRDGAFKLSDEGWLVSSDGYRLQYDGSEGIPQGAVEVAVAEDGRITVTIEGQLEPMEFGQVLTCKFPNPAGLQALGRGIYLETLASGTASEARVPGSSGFGRLQQGSLEMSNVQIVEEMVNLIVAQRAYEINSKAIQTSDEILSLMNNLRR